MDVKQVFLLLPTYFFSIFFFFYFIHSPFLQLCLSVYNWREIVSSTRVSQIERYQHSVCFFKLIFNIALIKELLENADSAGQTLD